MLRPVKSTPDTSLDGKIIKGQWEFYRNKLMIFDNNSEDRDRIFNKMIELVIPIGWWQNVFIQLPLSDPYVSVILHRMVDLPAADHEWRAVFLHAMPYSQLEKLAFMMLVMLTDSWEYDDLKRLYERYSVHEKNNDIKDGLLYLMQNVAKSFEEMFDLIIIYGEEGGLPNEDIHLPNAQTMDFSAAKQSEKRHDSLLSQLLKRADFSFEQWQKLYKFLKRYFDKNYVIMSNLRYYMIVESLSFDQACYVLLEEEHEEQVQVEAFNRMLGSKGSFYGWTHVFFARHVAPAMRRKAFQEMKKINSASFDDWQDVLMRLPAEEESMNYSIEIVKILKQYDEVDFMAWTHIWYHICSVKVPDELKRIIYNFLVSIATDVNDLVMIVKYLQPQKTRSE